MALTMKPQLASAPGLGKREFFGLLELLHSSEQQAQMMRDLHEFEDKLNGQAEAISRRDSASSETERQLADRRTSLDADWVRLKQAQADLDNASATLEAKKRQNEREMAAASDALAEREKKTAGLQQALNDREAQIEKRRAGLDELQSNHSRKFNERSAELDTREAAIAAREKAADELASLMAKVKG